MTNEQREAIKLLERINASYFLSGMIEQSNYIVDKAYETDKAIDTVLTLIKEQQEKIEKYEKIIDKISQDPFNELRVDGIRFCGGDIKQYFVELVEKE